jgi:NAD+ kinase
MMRMAHAFPSIPLLGINFGKVGFLALVERAQWPTVLEQLLAGRFRIQDGPTLSADLIRGGRSIGSGWAINDVVVRAGMRMIDVELYVDRQYVNVYPGDGMIVASPQGSTAYGMAAGGPILTAGVRGFAVTAISAHSPIRATLVVPEESTIELVLANDHDAALIIDGQQTHALELGDVVTVTRGQERFRLIVTDTMNFYEAFRSKFNYLIRPDAVPSLGHDRDGS